MTGTRANPYALRLPPALYRTEGEKLGFDFTDEEIRRAVRSDRTLGVRRYAASRDCSVRFPIPPEAFVECRISERVI